MSSKKTYKGLKIGLGFFETVVHVGVYILVVFLFIRVATLGYDFSYHIFGDPAMSQYETEVVSVKIEEGANAQMVVAQLKELGLIKYELALRIRMKLEHTEDYLSPGVYELSPSMTTAQIISILSSPPVAQDDNLLGENASGTVSEENTSEEQEGTSSEGE